MLGAEAVVLYILSIAIVNLVLGFAAAVYAARRYRDLVARSSESAGRAPGPSASGPSTPVIPATTAQESPATSGEPRAAAIEADQRDPASIDEEALGVSSPGEDLSGEQARPGDGPPDLPRQLSPGEARVQELSSQVDRNAHEVAPLDAAAETDSLTDLSSRAGLERTLAEWWQKDPLRVRKLTMATIDVDELGRLNDRVGRNVCDRILRAMAQLLKAASRGHSVAARFSGQRFMLLFADVDLRFTINVVERIRQTIEMSRFESQGDDIRVTISCGVIEATSEDTSDSMYARAEATLREAKRYGRNRTFVHEGNYPTPVVPPNFALEEKSVPI